MKKYREIETIREIKKHCYSTCGRCGREGLDVTNDDESYEEVTDDNEQCVIKIKKSIYPRYSEYEPTHFYLHLCEKCLDEMIEVFGLKWRAN